MKSLINTHGQYLTQAAFDAWNDGVDFEGETWGSYDNAAIFHPDDAPTREIFDGEFVDALADPKFICPQCGGQHRTGCKWRGQWPPAPKPPLVRSKITFAEVEIGENFSRADGVNGGSYDKVSKTMAQQCSLSGDMPRQTISPAMPVHVYREAAATAAPLPCHPAAADAVLAALVAVNEALSDPDASMMSISGAHAQALRAIAEAQQPILSADKLTENYFTLSSWLKAALMSATQRDPVDAVRDAELLLGALKLHLEANR